MSKKKLIEHQKMKIIRFCEINGGMGGPIVEYSQPLLITEIELNEFKNLYIESYDNYFRLYKLNNLGMYYIERLGKCNQYNCPQKYIDILDEKNNLFTLDYFKSGTYKNKHIKLSGDKND